jgi:hypothetical protein
MPLAEVRVSAPYLSERADPYKKILRIVARPIQSNSVQFNFWKDTLPLLVLDHVAGLIENLTFGVGEVEVIYKLDGK